MFKISSTLLNKIKLAINNSFLEPCPANVSYYCSGNCTALCEHSCGNTCNNCCDTTCKGDCYFACDGTCKGRGSNGWAR